MPSFQKVFIYGVPGTGKSYLAKLLGKKFNIPIISGDEIRKSFRKGKSRKQYPLLYLGTCQAYKLFGNLNNENVVKGLLAIRKTFQSAILSEISKTDNFILEGAFLDPRKLKELGTINLLTTTNERQHKKQFLSHPEKWLDIAGNEFKAARFIQEYLIKEAEELDIKTIDNSGTEDKLLKDFFA